MAKKEDKRGEEYLEALERSIAEGRRFSLDRPETFLRPKPAKPASEDRPAASSGGTESRLEADGWKAGDILALADGSTGVYRGKVPQKEYQLVYFLKAEGEMLPQGVVLENYKPRRIGRLPEDIISEFKRYKRWNRDAVVFHLGEWENIRFLPPAIEFDVESAPPVGSVGPREGTRGGVPNDAFTSDDSSSPETPKAVDKGPTAYTPDPDKPRHGQRFSIKFGPSDWDAVYWAKDELGDIVVHDTNKIWTAMHLKLERFHDSLVLGDFLTEEELKKVNAQLEATSE